MPKRRRLFTPNKHKIKSVIKPERDVRNDNDERDTEVSMARGRLKGALMDVLEPAPPSDESESSPESSPVKRDRQQSVDRKEYLTDEEVKRCFRKSPPRQSYVLKLFDRSVDLSQFRDDSPLYPICRAWMVNQPKANYNKFESTYRDEQPADTENGVELPGPEGPPVPKIPDLLPEQLAANKDNINLNYVAPPPPLESLLRAHAARWAAVKQAWQDQMMLKEARYEGTQRVLNSINLEYPPR